MTYSKSIFSISPVYSSNTTSTVTFEPVTTYVDNTYDNYYVTDSGGSYIKKELCPYQPAKEFKAWELFKDLLFETIESIETFSGSKERNKLPDLLVSGSFPPANVYVDRKNSILGVEAAIAGYDPDDVNILFQDNYLELEILPKSEKENKDKIYLQRGIKIKSSKLKIFVPFDKFDIQKAKAVYKDGLLTIEIPFKEESKPIKLEIKK